MNAPLSILLVEDSPTDVLLAQDALQGRGQFNMTVVERLGKALDMLSAHPFDIVLLDLGLPDSQGLETLSKLRRCCPSIPVIVMTALDDEKLALQAVQQGSQDYLVKSQVQDAMLARSILYAIERHQSKQALQEHEELFRGAFEHTAVAMVLTDPDNRFVRVNESFARMFGYTPPEMAEMTMAGVTHPDDIAESLARRKRLLAGEDSYFQVEKRYLHRDGHTFWGLTNVSLVRGADRKPLYYVGQVQDVTEQKRAENERDRLFIESLSLLGLLGFDGRIVQINPSWERTLGYTVAELKAEPYMSFVHPDDHPASLAQVERMASGAVMTTFENRLRCKDGSYKSFLWSGTPLLDQKCFSVSGHDMTEQKEAVAALRASEASYRTLFETAPDGIAIIDPKGYLLETNASYCSMIGYTRDELAGLHVSNIIGQSDQSRIEPSLAEVQATSRHQQEWQYRRKDGSVFVVEAILTMMPGGNLLAMIRDTTDRTRAEKLLFKNRKRLRDLIDGLGPDTFLGMLTPEGILVDANLAPLVASGLNREDILGQHFAETPWWNHSTTVQQQLREAIDRAAHGEPSRYDVQVLGVDNQIIDIDFSLNPMRDEDGAVVFLIPSANVITERKRAEEALRGSEERLRSFVENVSAPVAMLDREMRYVHVSRRWMTDYRLGDRDLTGLSHYEVFPEVPASWREIYQRCLAGAIDLCDETRFDRADGTFHWLRWEVRPWMLTSGEIGGIMLFTEDITDRKKAEDSLWQRDRAIQSVTQGIVITDVSQPDNPIIYAGAGFERMTGYKPAEVLGGNCRFLQGPDTDQTVVAQIREALRAGEPCVVEMLNYRKDGTPFWNELSIAPVRDLAGQLTHFVGIQTDVTARRSLESQFRQAQKMEAFGQLAGGVAHDFNNLLTVINGYSNLLLQSLPNSDPSREMIAEIHNAGERSASLTRQLLAFTRQQVLAPRVLNLNEVLTETDKMLRRLIGEDVRLTTTLDSRLWAVKADPGQIEQVLLNLSVNARDAMPTGGRLTIQTQNVELDETYTRTHADVRIGPHVLLSVTDTGSGMSPEVQARIFEPFFTTKSQGKGTGLGLATVFGIVKQSGGHVAVYSEVGVGTSFKVYLPRVEQQSRVLKAPPSIVTLPRGTETVLIAEDADSVRSLTRYILAHCGYNVLEAADGDEALQIAASHPGPIHLLISDVVMPGASGRAVSEQIARQYPEVRVLYISGYTNDAVIRHGVLSEGVNYMQKPFTPLGLALKVREVLDS